VKNGIYLFSFQMSPDDCGKALSNCVYNRILKLVFVVAKANYDLGSVQQVKNVIEDCFRNSKPSLQDGILQPSPVIIKLPSKQLKQAILKKN
jgi:hypothetical protein